MRLTASLITLCALAACGAPETADQGASSSAGGSRAGAPAASIASLPGHHDTEGTRFTYETVAEIDALFDRLGYTPERWQAGIREVPRIYLTTIAPRWRERIADSLPVVDKKRIFFRLLAPLALRADELILADRARLERLGGAASLAPDDQAWLRELAADYGVDLATPEHPEPDAIARLLDRVDAIPASLALAQAAEESGWGTSRFAAEGNALFGQWTWGENAMRPEQQRRELGDYGLASFETPLESVLAYMHNLNTHPAYADLRKRRAERRAAGEPLRGDDLAEGLTRYSERGSEYVTSLRTIMRVNGLAAADDAFLTDQAPVFLVPVGEGA